MDHTVYARPVSESTCDISGSTPLDFFKHGNISLFICLLLAPDTVVEKSYNQDEVCRSLLMYFVLETGC